MKYIAIAFVCLIVVTKVASKVAPEVGKTLRATSPEIPKSKWQGIKKEKNIQVKWLNQKCLILKIRDLNGNWRKLKMKTVILLKQFCLLYY